MRALPLLGWIMLLPGLVLAQTEEAEAPVSPTGTGVLLDGATPAERAQALVRYSASATLRPKDETYPKAAMAAYAARLLTGRDTAYALEKIKAAVDKTLEIEGNRNPGPGIKAHALDPFNEFALMDTYLLVRDKIPTETAMRIRTYMGLYTHRQWVGYGAMNYRLMEDGAGYLAAQEWPDLADVDGLNAEQIKAATKERLLGYCDEIVHRNFHEYGSPIYLCVDLAAMKMLADQARDAELQKHASLALDSMFTDIASSWNQGYSICTAGRAKYWGSNNTSPDAMESTATSAWIYFGGKRPISAAGSAWNWNFWLAAPGSYQPPALLDEIANDRTGTSEYRSTVASMPGHDIRRLVYHAPSYSLASQWDRAPNPESGLYKESRRMMLRWISSQPSSTFIVCQENPRRPYALKEKVANAFGYGENPFSQYLQERGTMIGLCNVPDNYPYWKIYAPFPQKGGIVARLEKDGWVFCHGGSMLFGFRVIQPYTWGQPQQGCDVLWSDARKNGWILETAEVNSYAGGGVEAELARFADAVLHKTKIDASHLHDDLPRLVYDSLDGHRLDLTYLPHGRPYTDQSQIDGEVIDYAAYPLFDSPWVHQGVNDNLLTVSHKGRSFTCDFADWIRKE